MPHEVEAVPEGEHEEHGAGEVMVLKRDACDKHPRDELRKIAEVSYVRFASVYREFRDAETFMKELSKLGIETK